MKYLYFKLLFLVCSYHCISQKILIDSSVYGKWPSVSDGIISSDGNYCMYSIKNEPFNSHTLVVKATKGLWKLELKGATHAQISPDARLGIFINSNDSLGIITLNQSKIKYIPNVTSYKYCKNANYDLLGYYVKDTPGVFKLYNISTGLENTYDNIKNFWFAPEGKGLLLQNETNNDINNRHNLYWIHINTDERRLIWKGNNVNNLIFDNSGMQVAFTEESKFNSDIINSIYYYKIGESEAKLLVNDQSPDIDNGLVICSDWRSQLSFSNDGSRLFFNLKSQIAVVKSSNNVKVDVWTYKDALLQENQLEKQKTPVCFLSVVRISDRRVFRLEHENEKFVFNSRIGSSAGGFLFRSNNSFLDKPNDNGMILRFEDDASLAEWNWNPACKISFYLISTIDGTRKRIRQLDDNNEHKLYLMSPGGKFILYYSPKEKNYFSYEISSGIIRNITIGINATWTGHSRVSGSYPEAFYEGREPSAWFNDDSVVLINDRYDIWKLDISGKINPINLTNGYGRKHKVDFHLIWKNFDSSNKHDIHKKLILSAFNNITKENGFYSTTLSSKGIDPSLLTMGPYIYYLYNPPPDVSGGFVPIKSKNTDTYLVTRMSETESPNYYFTSDFRLFSRLSDVYPEKQFNWLTNELHAWKMSDGSITQGILYKPENFDPKIKYPIIIYYYRTLTEGLHEYIEPKPCDGRLRVNISNFVSNGYLVFTPDIQYKIGKTGESALRYIVSSAKYLSKMKFVDSNRMGIQGHSFGGFETNYIVTHTNIFAAACSSSGISDCISGAYGTLFDDGSGLQSKQSQFEMGPYQIGTTIWQRPDLYIKNSPIFQANKVTTPFLMMHTKKDVGIPFTNALEMFTALRRLKKKVWLLQYDDGDHVVWDRSAEDFSIRLMQFFDHYLKGKPPPKWLTSGVPASQKGINSGLEADLFGKP